MIAGTLGPVASAFSICALVRPWRMHIPPGLDVTKAEYVSDPDWLVGINAAQLGIALIANLFLLLNMAQSVRFSIAQPITIAGWYISALCLMALASTASGPLDLEPEIEYIWSQAFFYGIFAAILYFIVATLMSVTVWGAQTGHYEKDFELSPSQRTLMLQTILFLMYLLIGALVFSTIEEWSYLDTVYWADVTLFTVGYGDMSPQTTLGRALLIPYALIGVISLGLVIGSIRSLMLDRGKRRMEARVLEKKRRQYLRKLRRTGRNGLLQPIDEDVRSASLDWNDPRIPLTELDRRRREFELMRKIQARASVRRRWAALAISTSTWLALWLIGAKIFQESEAPYQGWSYFDAFYFAFTGLTTIGYGDLTPLSSCGKAFFVFWSLLALPTMTVLISNAGDTVVKWVKESTLRIGNVTILPGENGFKKDVKKALKRLTFGVLFTEDENVEEDPPGFLGAAQPRRSTEEQDTDDENELDNVDTNGDISPTFQQKAGQERAQDGGEKPRGRLNGSPSSTTMTAWTAKTKRSGSNGGSPKTLSHKSSSDTKTLPMRRATTVERSDIPTELPRSRAQYHLTLIDEIARVTKHLQHKPPRRYTYKEWAWYLRLMGEDESSAETHRPPEPRKPSHCYNKDDAETIADTAAAASRVQSRGEDSNDGPSGAREQEGPEAVANPAEQRQQTVVKWSWVGHRSPLLDSREEAEWILDRLEQRLHLELQRVAREEEERGRQEGRKEDEHESENEKGQDGSRSARRRIS